MPSDKSEWVASAKAIKTQPGIEEIKGNENEFFQELYKIQKEIKKSSSRILLVTQLSILGIVFLFIITEGIPDAVIDLSTKETELKTRYFIENLKGDTQDTWKSWRLVGATLNVNILKSTRVTEHHIDIIKNAILSEKTMEIGDNSVRKGFDTKSTYYEGWLGAIKSVSDRKTKYNLPTNFNFVDSSGGEGDVIINLSNLKDTEGYSGYTKSVVEGNEILKVFIVIYDISSLSDSELSAITRHEFGHALGLGHSTAPEDLMSHATNLSVPYISKCNLDAIVNLYNAKEGVTVCQK